MRPHTRTSDHSLCRQQVGADDPRRCFAIEGDEGPLGGITVVQPCPKRRFVASLPAVLAARQPPVVREFVP